jgi:hypothetical protein
MKQVFSLPLASLTLITLVALQALPAHAQTQPAIKGDMPCLSGICLGDHPSTLKGLPLIDVPGADAPFGPGGLSASRKQTEESVAKAGLGLNFKTLSNRNLRLIDGGRGRVGYFDAKSLGMFDLIKLSCKEDLSYRATFKEKDDSTVTVTVALRRIPDDAVDQKWVIAEIERRFQGLTEAERLAMYESYETRWLPLLKQGQWDDFVPLFQVAKNRSYKNSGFSYGPNPHRLGPSVNGYAESLGPDWIATAQESMASIAFPRNHVKVTKLRETLPACQGPARTFE